MPKPWKHLTTPQDVDIVAPDGTVRCRVAGHYSGSMFIIDDLSVDVQAGDEIRRMLPNGKEEAFHVDDPRFYDGAFSPHYQVKVSRKGTFPRHSGGNYNINLHGLNPRVNIGSTDNSTNTAVSGNLFSDIRCAVESGVSDPAQQASLLSKIDDVEKAKGTGNLIQAYQQLIASAADHMTILAPFLPALTQLLKL